MAEMVEYVMFKGREKVFHIFHIPNNNSFLKKIYTQRARTQEANKHE